MADILTVAAALAAELEDRPWATLVPHVLPMGEPGFPVYAVGAVYPRTAVGRAPLAAAPRPLLMRGEEQGRARAQRGARARRAGAARARARRHLAPARAGGDLPPARVPAPRRRALAARDRAAALGAAVRRGRAAAGRRAARAGRAEHLAGPRAPPPARGARGARRRARARARHAPTGAPPSAPLDVPANARLVDWVSYARTMPRCAAVVCHAGHGTVVRALASGVPVVACPHAGDMAENAARLRWAGLGVSLPRRFHTPRGVRLAVRRLLADPGYAERRGPRARLVRDATTGPPPPADEVEGSPASRYPPVTPGPPSVARVTRQPSLWIDRESTRDPDAGPFSAARWRRQAHEAERPPAEAGGAGARRRRRAGAAAARACCRPWRSRPRSQRWRCRRVARARRRRRRRRRCCRPRAAARLAPDPGRPRLPVGRPGRGLGPGRVGVAARASSCARDGTIVTNAHVVGERRDARRCASATAAAQVRGRGARHRPLVRPRRPARRPGQRRAAAPAAAGRLRPACAWATRWWRSATRSGSTGPPPPGSSPGSGARSRRPTASRSTR